MSVAILTRVAPKVQYIVLRCMSRCRLLFYSFFLFHRMAFDANLFNRFCAVATEEHAAKSDDDGFRQRKTEQLKSARSAKR